MGLGKGARCKFTMTYKHHSHQNGVPAMLRTPKKLFSLSTLSGACMFLEMKCQSRSSETTANFVSRQALAYLFGICIQIGGTVEVQRSSGGRSVWKTGMAFCSAGEVYCLEHDLWICVQSPARLHKAPKI